MIQLTLSQAGYTAMCAATGEGTPFSLYKMYLSTVVVSSSAEPDLSDIQSNALDCEPTGANGHYTGTFTNNDSSDYEAKSIVITFMVNEGETIFAWGSEDITVPGNSVKNLTFAFSIEIQGAGVVNFSGATTYASLIGSGPNSHPAIGRPAQPVYVNSSGQITASDAYVGHSSNFIYMENGEFKRSEAYVGGEESPVYIQNGTFVPCDPLHMELRLKPILGENYTVGDLEISGANQRVSCCISREDGNFDHSFEPDFYFWHANFPALQKFSPTKESGKNFDVSITPNSVWDEHNTNWWVLRDPTTDQPFRLNINRYSYVTWGGGRFKDSSRDYNDLILIESQTTYLDWKPGEGGEGDWTAYPHLLNKFFFGDDYRDWGGIALHIYNGNTAEIVVTSETLKDNIEQGNTLLSYIYLWGYEFSSTFIYPKICFELWNPYPFDNMSSSANYYNDIVIDQKGYLNETGSYYSVSGRLYSYNTEYWGYELDSSHKTAYTNESSFSLEIRPEEIELRSDSGDLIVESGYVGIKNIHVLYGMLGGNIAFNNSPAQSKISLGNGATEIGEITLDTIVTDNSIYKLAGSYSLKTNFDDLDGCYLLTVAGVVSKDNVLISDTTEKLSFYTPLEKSSGGYEAVVRGLDLTISSGVSTILTLDENGNAYLTCDDDISITQADALKIKIFSSKIGSLKVTSGTTADKKTELFMKPDQFIARAKETTLVTIEASDFEEFGSTASRSQYEVDNNDNPIYDLDSIVYGTFVEFLMTKDNTATSITIPASNWIAPYSPERVRLYLHGMNNGEDYSDWTLFIAKNEIRFMGLPGSQPSDYFDSFTVIGMKKEELVIPSLRCSRLTEGDPSLAGATVTPDSVNVSGYTPDGVFSELLVTNDDIRINTKSVLPGETYATGAEIYADPWSYEKDENGRPIVLTASQIKAMIDAAGGGGSRMVGIDPLFLLGSGRISVDSNS